MRFMLVTPVFCRSVMFSCWGNRRKNRLDPSWVLQDAAGIECNDARGPGSFSGEDRGDARSWCVRWTFQVVFTGVYDSKRIAERLLSSFFKTQESSEACLCKVWVLKG